MSKTRGSVRPVASAPTTPPPPKRGHSFRSGGVDAIAAERKRQIEVEGWKPEHDDQHKNCELAVAAACYVLWSDSYPNNEQPPIDWPWEPDWWKPKDYRADLVRAGALIAAEIDRLDRLENGGGK